MGESLRRGSGSGVGVVDKVVVILDTLAGGPHTLADLAVATALPRATAHRLSVALEWHGLVTRDEDGRFLLGDLLKELGRVAGQGHRSLTEAAVPALTALRDRTGESTQLYVRSGDRRVCALSLESPHSLRTMVAVGASLPMDKGSAGRVLSQEGANRRRWVQSVEERERGVASVSAPVVVDDRVVAAVSVSGPIDRTSRQPGRRYARAVVEAARAVERAMA